MEMVDNVMLKNNIVHSALFHVTLLKYYHIRFLYIPLINAERAWAYGMQLKQEANTETRKRFHLLRRLRRAVVHSSNLLRLCEKCGRCDTRTKLEAQAYAAWMLGNVQFEQQQWKEAFENFGNAQ